MKNHFGNEISKFTPAERSAISAAVQYEFVLHKFYALWNILFMLAGVFYAYSNAHLLTTYELLAAIGLFWAASGAPFFILRDLAKRKFAASLPGGTAENSVSGIVIILKILAGLAIGSWATHVMLIYTFVKVYELRSYSKELALA